MREISSDIGRQVSGPTPVFEHLYYPDATGYVFAANGIQARLQLPFYGQIILATSDLPVVIRTDGQVFEQHAMAVWARDVTFDAPGTPLVVIGVNPLHASFRAFAALASPYVRPLDRSEFAPLDRLLCSAMERNLTYAEALMCFNGGVEILQPHLPAMHALDERAQSLMRVLWNKPRSSLDDLAAHLGLSYHHTSHLFAAAVGLPIRAYQLWQKLYRAGAPLLAGASLTEAAHAAGFVDSAHYSRAFQTAYGRSPSEMFKSRRITVFHSDAFSGISLGTSPAAPVDVRPLNAAVRVTR